MSNPLLLEERPIVLQPSLIKFLGFEMATVIQQVHWYLQNPKSGREIEGQKWVFNTYAEWQENDFPFWSERTVQRWLLALEKKGLLLTCQPDKADWDRRKFYRINYPALKAMMENPAPSIVPPVAPSIMSPVAPSEIPPVAPSYKEAKTSSKTSSKRGKGLDLTGQQKPAARTLKAAPFFEPDPAEKQVEAYTAVEQSILSACGMKKPRSWKQADTLALQAAALKAEGVTPEEIRAIVAAKPERVIPLGFFAERLLAERAAKQRGMSAPYVQHAPRNACKANGGCDGSGWITFPDERGIEKCVCYA